VQMGAKSHLWQGGRTEKSRRIRNSIAYQAWRTEIFERDDFTCHMCGKKGGKLSAHHIITLSEDPSRILDTSNGITLCWDCHGSIRWHEKEYEAEFFAAIQSRSVDEAIECLYNM
jgi:5-methylcytosine-specific restriction endonuclease McrA